MFRESRIEAAQTPEELLALAKESGYELTREQLEAVAGGGCERFKEFWECGDNYWP